MGRVYIWLGPRRSMEGGIHSCVRQVLRVAASDFERIVDLIGHTRTARGLRVRAKLDKRRYPTGVAVTDAKLKGVVLRPHDFHGEWNYQLVPRST